HADLERPGPLGTARARGAPARHRRSAGAAGAPPAAEQARQISPRRHGHGLGAAPRPHQDRPRRTRAIHPLTMRPLIAFLIALLLTSNALAQDKPAAGPTVRPEVGKPLQAAI